MSYDASCRGKEAFQDISIAWMAAARRPNRQVYKCQECGQYHVGTRKPAPWKFKQPKSRQLLAVGMLLLMSILIVSPALAVDCAAAPDRTPGLFWRYRVVDGARCWYRGDAVLPRSELTWDRPELAMPFNGPQKPVRDLSENQPVRPILVPTVSYRLQDGQQDAKFELQGALDRHTVARIVLGAGIGLVIAGMLWPMRWRAKQPLAKVAKSGL